MKSTIGNPRIILMNVSFSGGTVRKTKVKRRYIKIILKSTGNFFNIFAILTKGHFSVSTIYICLILTSGTNPEKIPATRPIPTPINSNRGLIETIFALPK